ncbi:MAG: ATP-binding protein [Candidatus Omnitrophica bacterium]|nr:ATP-binding protein [Candidatus Omnitrophota bacterium]
MNRAMDYADLRPALSAHLTQRLRASQEGFRHNLAVLGPAGSGKSTLVQHAMQTSATGSLRIFCSLQRESLREFLRRFAAALLRGALDAPPDTALPELLAAAAPMAPRTVAAIQLLEQTAGGQAQADTFLGILDLVPLIHKELRRPCLLVFDEFLHLEDLGLSHAFHEVGKRVMTWPFATFLVTSSATARARTILHERLHLLFGQFEIMTLGPIEPQAAIAWMEQILPGAGRQPELTSFLLRWNGQAPGYLVGLLTRLHELAILNQETRQATIAHLSADHLNTLVEQAVWDVLGSPEGAWHQRFAAQVERLAHQPHGLLAREALLAIAQGARTNQAVAQRCGTRRKLPQVLQGLVEAELVQQHGACWMISDQPFACWLTGVLGPTLANGWPDRDRAQQHFVEAFRAMWTGWHEVAHTPLVERVGELFGKFRNETVLLDQKIGRLPAFGAFSTHRPHKQGGAYLIATGEERRWCCLIHEGQLDETAIANFERFCRTQAPRPLRKVVIAKGGLDLNAKLLAKEANMWVWEPDEMNLLFRLYGQPPLLC